MVTAQKAELYQQIKAQVAPDLPVKLLVGQAREVLTAGGRTLAQGALGWLWARSPATVPIPGFKTVAQVEENAGALVYGPLAADQMAELKALMAEVYG